MIASPYLPWWDSEELQPDWPDCNRIEAYQLV
jgi:hypothetical protein